MARRGGRRPTKPTPSSRGPSSEEQAAAAEADQRRRKFIDKLEQFEVADLSGNSGRRPSLSAGAGVDMKQLVDAEMYDQTEQQQQSLPSAAAEASSRRRKRRKPKTSQSGSEDVAAAAAAGGGSFAASDSALQVLGGLNEGGIDDAVAAEGRGTAVAALDNNEIMLERIMSRSGSDDGHSSPRPNRRRHSFDGITAIANDMPVEENYDFDDCDLYGDNGEKMQSEDAVQKKQSEIASSDATQQQKRAPLASSGMGKGQFSHSMQNINMDVGSASASAATTRPKNTRAYMDSVYCANDASGDDLEAQMKAYLATSAIPSPDVMPKRSLTQRVKNVFSGRRTTTPTVSPTTQSDGKVNDDTSKRRDSLYTEDEEQALSDYISDAASVTAALELDGAISSKISEAVQRGNPAFTVPLAMVVTLAILLLSIPLVYVPPALSPGSPPAWVPVLSTASLLSSHAFGMLAVFFVFVFDFGQTSIVGRPVGELLEAGSMILWFFLLIPLSLSLHHLCEFRTKQTHHLSRSLSLVGPVTVKSNTPFHGAAMQRPGGHFDLDLL